MADGNVYICYGTLNQIEKKINDAGFFKSHKSYLVTTGYIKLIRNEYVEKAIEFDCIKERAAVSRRRMRGLKQVMG